MTVAVPIARRKRRPPRSGPQAADLLAWYDRHRRDLPWRAPPGARPDPYRVWLSEIMLQQTGVKAVAPYFARFAARWPNVRALAAAPLDDVLRLWAGLGYYARARNLHACAKAVVERHGGLFPRSEAELGKLPGIGRYTAAAIAAIAFDAPAVAIDGNAERVVARLFAVEHELPAAKAVIRQRAESLLPAERAGDFAQALMDLGATLCTPKKPACALCPWRDDCTGRHRGHPESFPIKAPKKEGRLRRGAAFDFAGDAVAAAPRLSDAWPKWRRIPGVVTHVFTHFPLELVVYAATVAGKTPAPAGMRWVARAGLPGEALPNLMRKVLAHALG